MNNKEIAIAFITGKKTINASESIVILEKCDDLYTNDGESFLDDSEYDALFQLAKRADPRNPYFLGVGSDVRSADKVKLPLPMGSLDQVQEGEIKTWLTDNDLKDEDIAITDKMDGISVCLIYNTAGVFQIALTRGDGYEGQDITRHVKNMKDVPKQVSGKMIVRAEIEFAEGAFTKVKKTCKRKDGSEYKNARNACAGMMNNDTQPDTVYKNISVLAYDIMGVELSKKEQLQSLKDAGFNVVHTTILKGRRLDDKFLSEYIAQRKKELDFAIDGIVLDIDSDDLRSNMTDEKKADSINPAYAIKYKVLDLDNIRETTVLSVEWNLSKNGFAKPKVKLKPFNLQGVTISNTTGFNAKYIKDNNIGAGTVVKMTRSGDVIPYILEVVKSTKAEMPDCLDDYVWSDNCVDLILKNMNNDEVKIKQLLSWATSLDIPSLKEGSVRELFDKGYKTPADVVNINRTSMVAIVGKNGNKIIDGMASILSDVPPEKLFGSSPAFGVGLGVRKFKALFKEIPAENLLSAVVSNSDIEAVDGFDEKTADKLFDGMAKFKEYLSDIDGKYTLAVAKKTTQGEFTGKRICFTGFRDKDLEAAVEAQGGEICSGVSKKTDMLVAVDISGESGKLGKAKDLGIKTISKEDLEKSIDKAPKLTDNTQKDKNDKFFDL